MNKGGLKKNCGRVQLVPVAHWIERNRRLLEPNDDD
jgi:hypothetical protein